jgi:hypothetical protein
MKTEWKTEWYILVRFHDRTVSVDAANEIEAKQLAKALCSPNKSVAIAANTYINSNNVQYVTIEKRKVEE